MDIPKKTINGIKARINACCKKHGSTNTRLVMQRWVNEQRQMVAIEQAIAKKQADLKDLEAKRKLR